MSGVGVLVFVAAQALTPGLPSAAVVFQAPRQADEIAARCAGNDACARYEREQLERVRVAYESEATTSEQRYKILSLIDEYRAKGPVAWSGVAQNYFAWRATVRGEPIAAPTNASETTTETRCVSSGWRYSSSVRCTTTSR